MLEQTAFYALKQGFKENTEGFLKNLARFCSMYPKFIDYLVEGFDVSEEKRNQVIEKFKTEHPEFKFKSIDVSFSYEAFPQWTVTYERKAYKKKGGSDYDYKWNPEGEYAEEFITDSMMYING